MTKLELLHVFLNDRLTAVAEEIFRAIKDTFVQFQSEIRRSKEENERLKRLLNVAVQRLLLQPEACAVQSQDHDDIHDSGRVSGVQVKKEPRLGDVHSGCMHDGGRDPEKEPYGPFETQSRLVQTLCCSDTVSPSPLPLPLPLPLPFKETEWENEGHFAASSSSSSTRALHSDTRGGGGATAENSYGSVQKDLSGSLAQQVTGLPCTNKKQSVHLLQLKGMKCLKSPPPPSRNAHAATIQRWHTCKECGKGFSFACQLEVHMRWHTKEKPYSCTVCRKSFTTVSMLKRHHRIHTGEKPFACHVCGKRFNQSAHLNTHFRLHTRERASWSRAPFPRNPQSAGN